MADPIAPPQTKWPYEKLYSDTQRPVLPSGFQSSSAAIERGQHPMTYDTPRDRPSQIVTGNNKYSGTAPFSASRARSWTLPPARGPSVHGTQRIAARAFPPPVRPRPFKTSLTARKDGPQSALPPPWTPINASSQPQPTSHDAARSPPARPLNPGFPWVNPLRPEAAYPNTSQERRPVIEERNEGDESDEEDDEEDEEEDEEDELEECNDDNDRERDDEEYEGETEGEEGAIAPRIVIHPAPTTPKNTPAYQAQVVEPIQSNGNHSQVHLRDAKPRTQLYTAQSKPLRPASSGGHRVPQGRQHESPPVTRGPEMRPDAKYLRYPPTHETLAHQPASFDTSDPRRAPLEGPHQTTWPSSVIYLTPVSPASKSSARRLRSFTNVAGPPPEWCEVSEAGGSEHRSVYSLQSGMSVAQSIYMEKQIALREEQVARREEEAARKEEGARSLDMAARKAFEWAQGLEVRAGRIHDAAMEAQAQVKRQDAKIWEKESKVLKKQAEMARREVELARREIAAERAEQEARREKREAFQKGEELLLKEEDVRRKEEDVQRKEEDVRRQEQEAIRTDEDLRQRAMEIRRREKRLRKRKRGRRRATEDRTGTKGALVAAWEKLKARISRRPQSDEKESLARIHGGREAPYYSLDSTDGRNSDSTLHVSTQDAGSTREGNPGPRDVERWRSTVGLEGIQNLGNRDLKSGSNTIPSGCRTATAEASAEYTVKTVVSCKERVNRSPAGYFRHT